MRPPGHGKEARHEPVEHEPGAVRGAVRVGVAAIGRPDRGRPDRDDRPYGAAARPGRLHQPDGPGVRRPPRRGGRTHAVAPAADRRDVRPACPFPRSAGRRYQRDEAEFLTASVPGVLDIQNHITLTTAPADHDIGTGIRSAFRRNSRLDSGGLSVETGALGTVILAGTVKSWAEHDEAMAAV